MRLETALKRRDAAIVALRDMWSAAQHHGATHAHILEQRQAIRARLLAGAPRWVHDYFDGYAKALQDRAYESGELVFGGWYQRAFYSTHSSRPDYYGKHGIAASEWADDGKVTNRGHYWRGDGSRPFYLSGR